MAHAATTSTPQFSAAPPPPFRVRRMTEADIPAVAGRIQHSCYPPELHEDDVPYRHRLAGYPAGCFVVETLGGDVVAYAQGHPWAGDKPPAVVVPEGRLAPIPPARTPGDYFFLFDVCTSLRRAGVGEALAAAALQHAVEAGFTEARLVAVRGADTFWSRPLPALGYVEAARIPPGNGYGSGTAVAMRKALGGAPEAQGGLR